MKITISPHQFLELFKKGYDLNTIFLLKMFDENYDITSMCQESMKISSLYLGIVRKGLLGEEDKITTIGRELLDFVNSKDSVKLNKRKPATDDFLKWWSEFPPSDIYEYKGRKFSGSRSLRTNKEECRLKFEKLLISGEYSAEQLIESLKFDVLSKKENSLKTGTNKLSFMQNSLTYLRQCSFEPFIQLLSEGESIKESTERITDVYI